MMTILDRYHPDYPSAKYEYAKSHFTLRLKERYDIEISDNEYFDLCQSVVNEHTLKGMYKKNETSTLGTIEIKNRTVWVIYDNKYKVLVTALPSYIDDTMENMIRVCFHKSLNSLAIAIWNTIQKEAEELRRDFCTDKEAAEYYLEHALFPNLAIMRYKNKNLVLDKTRICHRIRSIIDGEHDYLTLTLTKKPKKD